jgi:hypothetical protein
MLKSVSRKRSLDGRITSPRRVRSFRLRYVPAMTRMAPFGTLANGEWRDKWKKANHSRNLTELKGTQVCVAPLRENWKKRTSGAKAALT